MFSFNPDQLQARGPASVPRTESTVEGDWSRGKPEKHQEDRAQRLKQYQSEKKGETLPVEPAAPAIKPKLNLAALRPASLKAGTGTRDSGARTQQEVPVVKPRLALDGLRFGAPLRVKQVQASTVPAGPPVAVAPAPAPAFPSGSVSASLPPLGNLQNRPPVPRLESVQKPQRQVQKAPEPAPTTDSPVVDEDTLTRIESFLGATVNRRSTVVEEFSPL